LYHLGHYLEESRDIWLLSECREAQVTNLWQLGGFILGNVRQAYTGTACEKETCFVQEQLLCFVVNGLAGQKEVDAELPSRIAAWGPRFFVLKEDMDSDWVITENLNIDLVADLWWYVGQP